LAHDNARGDVLKGLVPTCKKCNGSFSADEEDFRNFAILAGSFTEAAEGVFKDEMLRSLKQQAYGAKKLKRLMSRIEPQEEGSGIIHRIHLVESDFRVFRKIIRGLAYHHFKERFPAERVEARQSPRIREEYLDTEVLSVIHPEVFRYKIVYPSMIEGQHSLWFLEFFRTVQIHGNVRRAELVTCL